MYNEYKKRVKDMEHNIKIRESNEKAIREDAEGVVKSMEKIIAISMADPGLLKN